MDISTVSTLTYNVRRSDTVPLHKQKAWIKKYWGDKLLTKPVLLKGDRNYITFTVL